MYMPYCAFRADGKGSNLIAFQDEYVIFFCTHKWNKRGREGRKQIEGSEKEKEKMEMGERN